MADLTAMLQAAAGAAAQPSGYQISRSLRFNSADSAYLSRTPASAGNRKTWTWSGWVKRSALGSQQAFLSAGSGDTADFFVTFESDDAIRVIDLVSGTPTLLWKTTQVFRDVSSWYHIVIVLDMTQATSTNRVKIYVNGEIVTAYSSQTTPAQNTDLDFNSAALHGIGNRVAAATYYNGYMTEIHFVDGQALTPSSFGETNATTGVWSPIEYTGSYGTNGFYLDFSDNTSTTTLGYDAAGSNDWTVNNFSVAAGAGNDSLVDTPTQYGTDTGAGGEVRGNYSTLNPLNFRGTGVVSNGNLAFTGPAGEAAYSHIAGTIAFSSDTLTGFYVEATLTTSGNFAGVVLFDANFPLSNYNTLDFPGGGSGPNENAVSYRNDGNVFHYAATISGQPSYTTGDVIGIAVKDNKVWFAKNNVWLSGDPSAGTSPSVTLASAETFTFGITSINSAVFNINAGQRPFAYTAPSGFKALVTTNLPAPTVVQGDEYFNTVLYTGTGASQSITGVGFQPDWVWIKERNASADHALYDAVRGVQQQLESNTTTDETTESTGLTAFGSDGFTVGSLAQVNTSADTYVAWNWKESTTSKFDIVTYTGNGTARTISHNLGVVPNMIIVKARTTASTDQGWPVYHSANTANPETDYLLLNSDAATADLDTVWNDTAPTSSVFSVGTNALVNANNDTYVAYVFANVAGYSAFGSYTGNGSADGPFVYTGFRPAFVMIKSFSGIADHWNIFDDTRTTFNVINKNLKPNLANAEATDASILVDFVSNGFKLRQTDGQINGNTFGYIYMAFAESPFKFALGR